MKIRYILTYVLFVLAIIPISINTKAQAFTEDFNDITTLVSSGWNMQNLSNPVGVTNWFQGTSIAGGGPFDAYNGATNAYIGANYNNTGSTGTISNWLITPTRVFKNGDVISFYTRKVTPDTYADRLQVRLSTNGASTNAGANAMDVGDFSTLLLGINPSLLLGVYPIEWTMYTITINGLPAPVSGRIAFRYFITGGGSLGTNADYIGIDHVVYTPYVCPPLNITPLVLTDGTAGVAYSQSLNQTGALGTPYYMISAGNLPEGMILSPTGELLGNPTTTGTFHFTATVSDASGCASSANYSININCPSNGATFNISPSVVCSNAGPTTIEGGSPLGGTYSGTGITETNFDPTSGTQTITYTLMDPYGCTQVATDLISVNEPPSVTSASNVTDNTVCAGGSVTLTANGADTYVWDHNITNGLSFVPANTALYEVTGTSATTGCSSTSDVTVTVNTNPTVTASSDAMDNSICAGKAVTLTGGGADTYVWDHNVTNGISFTPINPVSYEVTGKITTTGCSATATITIIINELPSVNLTPFASPVSKDAGIIPLTGGTPAGGVYSGQSVTGGSFDASIGVGSYSITYTYTDGNGCVNTAQQNLVVNLGTGTPNKTTSESALVFPNPGTGLFTIVYNQVTNGKLTIAVFNDEGKTVVNEIIPNFIGIYRKELNLTSMPKGIYLLVVTGSNGSAHQKIILE